MFLGKVRTQFSSKRETPLGPRDSDILVEVPVVCVKIKVKVKVSLEHATKSPRGSRGIVLLFL